MISTQLTSNPYHQSKLLHNHLKRKSTQAGICQDYNAKKFKLGITHSLNQSTLPLLPSHYRPIKYTAPLQMNLFSKMVCASLHDKIIAETLFERSWDTLQVLGDIGIMIKEIVAKSNDEAIQQVENDEQSTSEANSPCSITSKAEVSKFTVLFANECYGGTTDKLCSLNEIKEAQYSSYIKKLAIDLNKNVQRVEIANKLFKLQTLMKEEQSIVSQMECKEEI